MEANSTSLEMRDYIIDLGAETLSWCMQCGLCTGLCPWRLVPGSISESFNIRKMQRLGQLGLEGFEAEEILFACTTCGMCEANCPRQVKIIDNVRSMRNTLLGSGFVPMHLRGVVGSLHANGNPWSGEREKRSAWMKDLDIPAFSENTEYLLFVCCTSCYDQRSQKIARSVAKLLSEAGVEFGVIGNEESCCGEAARKVGHEELFTKLAKGNIDLFHSRGVKKIITTSPHCLYTFKNDYPELGGSFEVVHYTELLYNLLKQGKLSFSKEISKKVTFHDPCYLGRHNSIYDAPRELLKAVPGLNILELDRNKSKSLCCAGGGGRIWAEVPKGERFGELRIADAVEKQADILATACPYCIIMLENDCLAMEKEDTLSIMEISELLVKAIKL